MFKIGTVFKTVIGLKFLLETVGGNKWLKANRKNLKSHSEVHTFEFILSEPKKQKDVRTVTTRLVKIL